MDSKQIDEILLIELRYARCGSRLRTSLSLKLADHASHLNGFRSSRQIPGDKKDEVEESFQELMDYLIVCTYEYTSTLEKPHSYKSSIFNLNAEEIEILLEDCLLESIIYDDYRTTFSRFFLE